MPAMFKYRGHGPLLQGVYLWLNHIVMKVLKLADCCDFYSGGTGGLDALRVLGKPVQLMHEAKGRLFGA